MYGKERRNFKPISILRRVLKKAPKRDLDTGITRAAKRNRMMDGVQSDGGNVSKRPKILTIVWLLIQLCVVAFVISGFMLLGKAATPYA